MDENIKSKFSEHVATLPLFWITGADISPDGQTLVLTNKVKIEWLLGKVVQNHSEQKDYFVASPP